jgi:hypothetical protein
VYPPTGTDVKYRPIEFAFGELQVFGEDVGCDYRPIDPGHPLAALVPPIAGREPVVLTRAIAASASRLISAVSHRIVERIPVSQSPPRIEVLPEDWDTAMAIVAHPMISNTVHPPRWHIGPRRARRSSIAW